jgi:hypothetical protein
MIIVISWVISAAFGWLLCVKRYIRIWGSVPSNIRQDAFFASPYVGFNPGPMQWDLFLLH